MELAPDYAEAHSNLGNVLRRLGRLDQATACWRRTVELRPGFAEAHYNLSVACADQENFAEAAACCRRAVARSLTLPRPTTTWATPVERGALDEAVACCRQAVALKARLCRGPQQPGQCVKDHGEFDEAIACYRLAWSFAPISPSARQFGHRRCSPASLAGPRMFPRGARLDPGYASAYFKLAELLRGELPVDDFAAASRLLAKGGLADWQQMLLHYGLCSSSMRGANTRPRPGTSIRRTPCNSASGGSAVQYDPQEQQQLGDGPDRPARRGSSPNAAVGER